LFLFLCCLFDFGDNGVWTQGPVLGWQMPYLLRHAPSPIHLVKGTWVVASVNNVDTNIHVQVTEFLFSNLLGTVSL
jgi:hypothetical protein